MKNILSIIDGVFKNLALVVIAVLLVHLFQAGHFELYAASIIMLMLVIISPWDEKYNGEKMFITPNAESIGKICYMVLAILAIFGLNSQAHFKMYMLELILDFLCWATFMSLLLVQREKQNIKKE